MQEFILESNYKQINILPKDIHVWSINLTDHYEKENALYDLLSVDEKKRASKYRSEKDRSFFIIARGIIRKIISYYLAVDPKIISFFYNNYGKPYINHYRFLCFNISHSEDLLMCIIAKNREVGIDVERIIDLDNYELIAQRFFSYNEYLNLKSVPQKYRLSSFYECWTRKEAFVKAIGNGFSYPFNQFEVSLMPNEPAVLRSIEGNVMHAKKWYLHTINFFQEYKIACAFKGTYNSILYWRCVNPAN